MYGANPDLVVTVTRDIVCRCQTPILVLPDDVPAHLYAATMEAAHLAPNSEASVCQWRETMEQIAEASRHVCGFLWAQVPVGPPSKPGVGL